MPACCQTSLSLVLAVVLAACHSPSVGNSEAEVVFGNDDRRNIYEITEPALLHAAQATVVVVRDSDLTQLADGSWELDVWRRGTNQQAKELCDSEAYLDEPVPGFCSGFMVGQDLIATAGHCIESQAECDSKTFVFGFEMTDATTPVSRFLAGDVYPCVEIVAQVFDDGIDYAILRVDRPIVGHTAVPIRRSGRVQRDPNVAGLFSSGHPVGLPMKVVGGSHRVGATDLFAAIVRDSYIAVFDADLDTFPGNSGSMVFSLAPTGEFLYAEGIVVTAPAPRYVANGSCYVVRTCSETAGCENSEGIGSWAGCMRSTTFAHAVVPPCGDAVCDAAAAESCLTCELDCGSCTEAEVIAADEFASGLNQWVVTGWETTSKHSSVGYPGSGSGSLVASANACDDCALSWGRALDLSGYDVVTLSYWRFVDEEIENGNFLAVSLTRDEGQSWSTLSIWGHDRGDTNRWEFEEHTLEPQYLVDTLRFSFLGVTDRESEYTQIDDVQLLGYKTIGCDGVLQSGKRFDLCGVCDGDGSSCAGCDGVANSGKVEDACGVCGGDGSSCAGCDGVPNSGTVEDLCGECGGDGSSCAGCDGVANSGTVEDLCGECDGDGSSCAGCDGVPNSGKVEDACGMCGGDGSSCADSVRGGCSSSGLSGTPVALAFLILLLWLVLMRRPPAGAPMGMRKDT